MNIFVFLSQNLQPKFSLQKSTGDRCHIKKVHSRAIHILSLLPWAALGVGAGIINGLLGAAGGILLVSLLPYLSPPPYPHLMSTRLDNPKDVLITSLCVMLPVTGVSVLLYALRGNTVDLPLTATVALPAAAGGLLGAYLMKKIPRNLLRKIFGGLVVVAGVRMLLG